MGIIGWILLGLLAGVIAKALMPGPERGGIILTTLLGIGGALLGGFLAAVLRLVVDLARVSFLDSTALGAVVRSLREIDKRGGKALIVLPRSSARRIFELTTLDRALPVAESRARALESLTPEA